MATVDSLAHRNLCDLHAARWRASRPARWTTSTGSSPTPVTPTSRRRAPRCGPTPPSTPRLGRRSDRLLRRSRQDRVGVRRVGTDDDITEVLLDRNFREWSQTPEMICEQPLPVREPPRGRAGPARETPADVADYARIAGEAFTHLMLPAEMTVRTVDRPDVMLAPDCVIALADLDGEPVAGALVVLFGAEPLGYVGWVACTRRRARARSRRRRHAPGDERGVRRAARSSSRSRRRSSASTRTRAWATARSTATGCSSGSEVTLTPRIRDFLVELDELLDAHAVARSRPRGRRRHDRRRGRARAARAPPRSRT